MYFGPLCLCRRASLMRAIRATALAAGLAMTWDCALSAPPRNRQTLPPNVYYIRAERPGSLNVVDGKAWVFGWRAFDGGLDAFRKGYGEKPAVKVVSSVWRLDEQYIRVFLIDESKGILPQHDAINGFYLTADYSTVPPRVYLTKEPAEGSSWSLESVENPKSTYLDKKEGQKYIRNLGNGKMSAWLCCGENDYLSAWHQNVVALQEPVLSFEKKTVFFVSAYQGRDDE